MESELIAAAILASVALNNSNTMREDLTLIRDAGKAVEFIKPYFVEALKLVQETK